MTEEQIKELLTNFEATFRANVEKAYKCGALSGDEPPMVVGRVVLLLTAEDFRCHSQYEAILKNLKHFV